MTRTNGSPATASAEDACRSNGVATEAKTAQGLRGQEREARYRQQNTWRKIPESDSKRQHGWLPSRLPVANGDSCNIRVKASRPNDGYAIQVQVKKDLELVDIKLQKKLRRWRLPN